jgi:predicted nucleic acid-binding protein
VSFLVDTNIFAESIRPKPEPRVVEWLRQNEPELYISTVTIGEIRRGVERLPSGPRKTLLSEWLEALSGRMRGRVLSYNTSTANIWGQLKAKWEKSGVIIASLDSQIAATAHRYQLVLVTRNAAHFEKAGVKILNPFLD